MASKTYYAGKSMSIESHRFEVGDVVGTGDVDAGQFKAADGLEKIVELGHVIPRLQDGRIVTEQQHAPAKTLTPSTPPSHDGDHDAEPENLTVESDADEPNETPADETSAATNKGRKARK